MKKRMFIGVLVQVVCTAVLWAASFSDLSLAEMETVLADAQLSEGVYDDNTTLQDGYAANGDFLNSSLVDRGFTTKDGNTVFRFNSGNPELDSYLYSYNPSNGMITPYDGDPYRDFMNGIMPVDYKGSPKPPDFAAQVTVKDGVTQIAFRGTQTFSDWKENGSQFLGNVPPQYELADCLAQAVQETSNRPLHVTGHSEGGGESQYVVLRSLERGRNDITGTGFNSQRLSKEVLDSFSPETRDAAEKAMTQYRVENDVVSGWGFLGEDLIGDTYEYDPVCWIGDYLCFAPLTAHEMDTVIDRIEAAIAAKRGGGASPGGGGDSSATGGNPGSGSDGSSNGLAQGGSGSGNASQGGTAGDDPFDSEPENDGSQNGGGGQPQITPGAGGGSSGGGNSYGGGKTKPTPRHRGGRGGGDMKARIW